MVFSGKMAITSFKLIQNAKSGGVLENSGYLLCYGHWDFQNWRRNDWENEAWSCQPPSPKIGRILCSQSTLIDPLSHTLGHYGPWTWHIRPRIQNYLYFTFYQCVEQILLSLQVMKVQRIIKGVHNVSSEFCQFLEGGVATSGFIFSGISSSILKISVPIM